MMSQTDIIIDLKAFQRRAPVAWRRIERAIQSVTGAVDILEPDAFTNLGEDLRPYSLRLIGGLGDRSAGGPRCALPGGTRRNFAFELVDGKKLRNRWVSIDRSTPFPGEGHGVVEGRPSRGGP
jgi:hypothetical protein